MTRLPGNLPYGEYLEHQGRLHRRETRWRYEDRVTPPMADRTREEEETVSAETQMTLPDAPVVAEDEEQGGEVSELVKLAIRQKVPVEVLERLVGLQERVHERDARAAFFEALSAFQDDVPEITKSAEAKIRTKSGNSYSYTYAPLDEITRTIRPLLREHDLSYSWSTEPGERDDILNVVCILRHVAGHEERAVFPVPTETSASMSGAQKQGAALTYGKRQSLTSVLGLTTSEDADGAGPVAAGQEIGEDEVAQLNDLIADADADVRRFCDYLGVEHLGKLTYRDYPKAVQALRRKIKKNEDRDES